MKYNVIGTRPIRHDGADKVTGRALYGADFQMAGMLRGFILRSPHSHARIKSIDTSKAEAIPGVHAVITTKDFPDVDGKKMVDLGEGLTPLAYARGNVLAGNKVLYRGHGPQQRASSRVHHVRRIGRNTLIVHSKRDAFAAWVYRDRHGCS